MPLLYKLYKDTRKKKGTDTPFNPKTYNKWLAKTVTTGTVESRELAEKIAYSSSATVADTLAVINALVNVMATNLKEGYRVKLDGFGSWKINVKSIGAPDSKVFSVSHNITGARVNFRPEYTKDPATGKNHVRMIEGAKIQETAKNDVI